MANRQAGQYAGLFEKNHCIVLVQPLEDKYTRTYFDFPTIADAMQGISDIFECKLRELNRDRGVLMLHYEMSDLFRYVDAMPDIALLVQSQDKRSYVPQGKSYIKNQLLRYQEYKRETAADKNR